MTDRAPVRVEKDRAVATVVLDRPELKNAFDDRLAKALRETFEALSADASVRVIVLRGSGDTFCAGGDLAWMRRSGALPKAQNLEDARGFASAYAAVDRSPKPVVARVAGVALGGGAGLVAACDVAIAAEDTVFGFPEVRLGIVPAAISPYVASKIGWSEARRWFLTGERFDAATARRMGLVHEVVPAADLDAVVRKSVDALLACGPEAVARAKRLLKGLNALAPDGAMLDVTAREIADARASAEGQEGLTAFLEKRRPSWAP
ncbi:MAG TPA: enoyl-CoA hydratase-related protein [Planctomycetota bacterium]|nr:enoyl-CoA hydratase-related protein [Planctomycetota bacterium]